MSAQLQRKRQAVELLKQAEDALTHEDGYTRDHPHQEIRVLRLGLEQEVVTVYVPCLTCDTHLRVGVPVNSKGTPTGGLCSDCNEKVDGEAKAAVTTTAG